MANLDVEDESILANIFKDSFPDNWKENAEFLQYLAELSSFGIEKLSKEPDRLAEERAQILSETQDLAFQNYKTFIQTAECSREIFEDFQIIERHVEAILDKLPGFSSECNGFLKKAQDITCSWKMNSLTLQKHTQLLEILEVPQLMDTCVRNGYYDEALELAHHVRRWEKKHQNIPVIVNIVNEVKNSMELMLNQLLQQLHSNIQLAASLRVIGYLRSMGAFTQAELRVKFLQSRDAWFQTILDVIPKDDPYTHITKTIEASRVHLFDIITQYRAIFSDDDPILSTMTNDGPNESALFHGWVVRKVSQFLETLEGDLARGVGGRLDSILGQCMYFGLSFSRVGADFRGLLAPIFQRAALSYFQQALNDADKRFEDHMQSYSLLATPSTVGGLTYGASSQAGQLYPPTILLDFMPLAAYCNDILSSFNDLRLCAPVSLVCDVTDALHASLNNINRVILAFHRAEESAFDARELEQFSCFICAYSSDLVPYINASLQTLFPPTQLAQILGVAISDLGKMDYFGTLNIKTILKSIEHLIPAPQEDQSVESLSSLVDSLTVTDQAEEGSSEHVEDRIIKSDQSQDATQPVMEDIALPERTDNADNYVIAGLPNDTESSGTADNVNNSAESPLSDSSLTVTPEVLVEDTVTGDSPGEIVSSEKAGGDLPDVLGITTATDESSEQDIEIDLDTIDLDKIYVGDAD